MTCEISAAVLTNSEGNEVWVAELPTSVPPPGCRVIGTMQFVDGKCFAKRGEETIAAAVLMMSAATPFAELVAVRLRERNDYREWRRKLLTAPSRMMAN